MDRNERNEEQKDEKIYKLNSQFYVNNINNIKRYVDGQHHNDNAKFSYSIEEGAVKFKISQPDNRDRESKKLQINKILFNY